MVAGTSPPAETLVELVAALHAQAARRRAVVEPGDLADIGQPGEGWDGAGPAALERVLFHLVQGYAATSATSTSSASSPAASSESNDQAPR